MRTENQATVEPLLLSKAEVASRLGICLRTVGNLIRARELSIVKIGRRVFVPARELNNFVRRDHLTKAVEEQPAA
jgi:excisionase family DNA binding protein